MFGLKVPYATVDWDFSTMGKAGMRPFSLIVAACVLAVCSCIHAFTGICIP